MEIKQLKEEAFRRATGVKKSTFEVMLEILETAHEARRKKGGPKSKWTVADRLLLTLEYLREYRTYLHIGLAYGVSESQACRIHRWVEKELMKDNRFHLPGRKSLVQNESACEVVLVDATESPVERPKKKTQGKAPKKSTEKIRFGKEKKTYSKDASDRRSCHAANHLHGLLCRQAT